MAVLVRKYQRIHRTVPEMPGLLEVQRSSFEQFLSSGIKRAIARAFPVSDLRGRCVLEFVDARVGDPASTPEECLRRATTYAAPLYATWRLVDTHTGEVREQELYMGDLPLLTPRGSFVVNGTERVVVSQFVRSPGVYFESWVDERGRRVARALILPQRGAWVHIEASPSGVYAYIERSQKKVPATTLLQALGAAGRDEILDLFAGDDIIAETLKRDPAHTREEAIVHLYEVYRQGELVTLEAAQAYLYSLFLDPRRYDLGKVGRYKLNRRLDVLRLAHHLRAREDVVLDDGSVLCRAGERVDCTLAPRGAACRRIVVEHEGAPLAILGNGVPDPSVTTLTGDDVLSVVSFAVALCRGLGHEDDMDHMGNRRVRTVGELLEIQVEAGAQRVARNARGRFASVDPEKATPKQLIAPRPLVAAIREFLGSSRLSQFMDQTNTLSEVAHKRRITALGPGGLSQETATLETRDVHHSHYGRVCPIETPEGENVGLINTLACYARINEYGFIETPYRVVDKRTGKITDQIVYLTADEEESYVIAPFDVPTTEDGRIAPGEVTVRFRGRIQVMDSMLVDYVDASPQQIVGVSAALIPFLEHTDAIRAGMGANMQRQAVPLIRPEAPIVMTGLEERVARDMGAAVYARRAGVVVEVRPREIAVRADDGTVDRYPLVKFARTNGSTCLNHRPVVRRGQRVEAGQVLADGSDTDGGVLALGANVLVAYMSWEGYNYEDAIVISERLVKDDVLTSIHISEYEVEVRETKLGPESMTPDVPNVPARHKAHLDAHGIAVEGARVGPGDILVGKVTPKARKSVSPEERLLEAIFGVKSTQPVRNSSLVMPHNEYGQVIGHERFSREAGDDLPPDVLHRVRVYVAQLRKIAVGDKLSGRHGNKGVVAKILPEADMPFLPDGRRVDVILSPLGVPSRMNIGQILECHLAMAGKVLGFRAITPPFNGATPEDVLRALEEAGLALKTTLYDGRTGEPFDQPVTVGYLYLLKLHHLVDDKIHARSTGPYSLVTQQPLGGKSNFGGQRFGEMEAWALEAYGAAHALQEMLTVKSDDLGGRAQAYEALVEGLPVPGPQRPESLVVLTRELAALGFGLRFRDAEGNEVDLVRDIVPRYRLDAEEVAAE